MRRPDGDATMAFDGAMAFGTPQTEALSEILARLTGRPPLVYLVNQYPAVTHTFIRREIQALEEKGFEIVRVAVRHGGSLVDAADRAEQARTIALLARPWSLAAAVLRMALGRPLGLLSALGLTLQAARRSDRSLAHHLMYLAEACGLAAVMARSRARHVHAHFGTNPAETAMLAAAITGGTYSFTVHGYDEYDKPEFLALSLKMRRATFIAAVSHYGRAQLLRWCDAGNSTKIHLVRCGLDAGRMAVAATEPGPRPARFVCVGRLCREKAQDVLLAAAVLLRDRGRQFELVLVGDGETRGALAEMILRQDLGSIVRMTGWLDGEGVRAEMMAARALVSPSFAENLPVVMMEAMALERPVIGTMIAGVPELVIPGETGWLVPASSVVDLADAMQACLDTSDEDMARLGRQGRARVERQHDVAKEAGKLAALLP